MSELDVHQRERLADLEAIVDRGKNTFIGVGLALLAIREERLYCETHSSFGDYLRDRWDMSRSRGYQLIGAAKLSTTVDSPVENEWQARKKIEPAASSGKLKRRVAHETAGEPTEKPVAGEILATLPEERMAQIASEVGKLNSGWNGLSWVMHLDQVTEEINESIANGKLTREVLGAAIDADTRVRIALNFGRQLLGTPEEQYGDLGDLLSIAIPVLFDPDLRAAAVRYLSDEQLEGLELAVRVERLQRDQEAGDERHPRSG